jgi:hypothetical protein
MKDITERVSKRYLKGKTLKTAGEVRFIKDKSGDANEWAFGDTGATDREIGPEFAWNPKHIKPLAQVLRSTAAALGHSMSAYNTFAKVKSAKVSPDGSLGGKGYVMKITNMRRQFMNVIEALSALSDTLYDEVQAPHWSAISRQETPEEKQEVQDIVEDAEGIRSDPEGWAEEEEEEMDEEHGKKAATPKDKDPEYVKEQLSKMTKKELEAYRSILNFHTSNNTILIGDREKSKLHLKIVKELLKGKKGKKATSDESRHMIRRVAARQALGETA